jgi:cell wall-associated NlpC family hydrolase
MFDRDALNAFVARWWGKPYRDVRCWELVQLAYSTQAIVLPHDYYAALAQFTVVTDEPQPWDVIAIRNHPFVTNHCALYLGDGIFFHTLETTGAAYGYTHRRPWSEPGRIAGYLRHRSRV